MNKTHFFGGVIFFGLLLSVATAQNVLIAVTVSPNISPFISDWREDATALVVRINNPGGEEIPRAIIKLKVTGIRSGEVVDASSVEFSIPKNGNIALYGNGKLLDASSIVFIGDVKNTAMATNRIPDDQYDVCCDVWELPTERDIATSCAQFEIRAASPPYLISPYDGETVMTRYPFFQWTPSRTTNKIEVRYSIMVRPLRGFQEPEQALESGTVQVFDRSNLSIPNVRMTTDAMELEDGMTYVWRVQVRDKSGTPLGENDGKSEVFKFTYLSAENMHEKARQDTVKTK